MATTATLIPGAALPQPPRPSLPETYPSLEERNAIVLEHLAEVRNIASGIARRLPRQVQIDDLIQAGTLGLIDAVTRFDRSRPLGLRQYLRVRVTGAILDSLRELDWASRYMRSRQQKLETVTHQLESRLGRHAASEEIAEEMGMDLQSFFEFAATVEDMRQVEEDNDSEDAFPVLDNLSQDPELSPESVCARIESRERVQQAMGYLRAEHRNVLRLYYFEEWTMAQIARARHVTESRISQIHARALAELSQVLRRRPLQ